MQDQQFTVLEQDAWARGAITARRFLGRGEAQRQRVQAAVEFRGQRRVHGARPRHAGLPGEGRRDDGDGEMRLAFRPRPGMAGMAVAVIGHRHLRRGEGGFEGGADAVGAGCHDARLSRLWPALPRGIGGLREAPRAYP